MKMHYTDYKPKAETLATIETANDVIGQYAAQGYDLTIRQLYYQLVARDYIPNNQAEYKRLVKILSRARLAGMISWTAIVDRTRQVRENPHWSSPQAIMRSVIHSFNMDKWQDQPYRPEVWIEKDALRGVIEQVCSELDVPHFSCRGYSSQSEMWRAAQRFNRYRTNGQRAYVIHLGDHDPSGLDMTTDIGKRLWTFGSTAEVNRIALNFDQVQEYDPPPNFAKETDSRMPDYVAQFGQDCWELDALEPQVITELIRETVLGIRDDSIYQKQVDKEQQHLAELEAVEDNYDELTSYMQDQGWLN